MAQGPRDAWAAMPPPRPPPRRRRPPGAGKALKLGSPASSKTLWKTEIVCMETDELLCPNSSSERCREVLVHFSRLLALQAPLLTVCLFAVPAATCHQSASPRCAARIPAAAPHPLAAIVAPKRKGKCGRRSPAADSVGPRPRISIETTGNLG